MASKAGAFHAWMNGFGATAYPAEAVPDDAEEPYITYSFGLAGFGEEFAAQVDLWFPADSVAKANAMCDRIGAELGAGGTFVECDGGALWLKKGSPFWQAVADEPGVIRRYMNIDIENLTS